jgi:hypothetical protein
MNYFIGIAGQVLMPNAAHCDYEMTDCASHQNGSLTFKFLTGAPMILV